MTKTNVPVRHKSTVQLEYPFEALPDNPENGKKRHAFYDPERYRAKQAEFGREIYPEPEPFKP